MFGDIGHGGALFILSTFLVLFNSKLRYGPLHGALYYRFILFLMGMFAFYNGVIYNDFFAVPLKWFGTCWEHGEHTFERTSNDCTVAFGIDSTWYQAANEISFINSFKMKISIVIGVCHMTLGILMNAVNQIHFNLWVDFLFVFIPQLVFFMCTFGYMAIAIIIKWTTDWTGKSAPPIINIFTGGGIAVSFLIFLK